jgi:hypothetical protein
VTLKDATARLAVLQAIRDALDEEIAATRADTWSGLIAARATLGLKSVEVVLPDGTKVGTCTITVPQPGVDVDTAAFLVWCAEHYPGEVVSAVREPFRRKVLAGLVEADGEFFYRGTLVPWAKRRPAGDPTSFSYRPTPAAAAAILDAYRNGRLTASVLPAIERGTP